MADIFGLFGVTDIDVARRMTLYEYRLRMRGYLVKYLEKEYFVHLQAMADRKATATDKNGKFLYQDMEEFYDRESRRREVMGVRPKPPSNTRLVKIAKNLQDYREGRR